MPLYAFRCDDCGHSNDEYASMSKAVTVGGYKACPMCKRPLYRRLPDLAHTDLKEYHKPIEMLSVACNSWEEIREIQDKCPDVEISTDPESELFGVPVAKNRKQKQQVLAATGFIERN